MTRDSTETHIDLPSANISYWTYNPHGTTTIVMVHGFRGTHHGLEDIIHELPKEYRVIIPDLPGFGESEVLKNKRHDTQGYVTFLHEFFDHLALEKRPVLLGHSFGSTIAAYYAAQYPDSIQKLILANPIASPALESSPYVFAQLTVFYYWIGNRLPRRLGRALLDSKLIVLFSSLMLVKSKDKQIRRKVHRNHLKHFATFQSKQSLIEAFAASTQTTVVDVAARLEMPTLLVAGDKDDIIPLKNQYVLQKKIPDAKLSVIPGVGHLIHYETPREVAREIVAFIDNDN